MTRDEIIAEIEKRVSIPLDFAASSTPELEQTLADLEAAARDPEARFSVFEPILIARGCFPQTRG